MSDFFKALAFRAATLSAVWAVLALVLLRTGPGVGAPASSAPASILYRYLRVVKTVHPEAFVSGSFYEWRSVSIYRRVAGIHDGYDIALPAGAAAPSMWPGRVTRIAYWAPGEWGITVTTGPGGDFPGWASGPARSRATPKGPAYSVTYGHLLPVVSLGEWIRPGQAVGLVAHDHVDIKMQDQSGAYLDFGQPMAAWPEFLAGLLPAPGPPRGFVAGELWNPWDPAGLSREQARVGEVEKALEAYLAMTRSRVLRQREDVAQMKTLGPGDMLSRDEWRQWQTTLQVQERELSRVYKALGQCRAYRDQLLAWSRKAGVKPKPKAVASPGSSPAGASLPSVNPPAVSDATIRALLPDLPEVPYPSVPGISGPIDPVANQALDPIRARAKSALQLYESGAVARNDRDEAVEQYRLARLHIILAGSEWARVIWPDLWWTPRH